MIFLITPARGERKEGPRSDGGKGGEVVGGDAGPRAAEGARKERGQEDQDCHGVPSPVLI